MQNDRDEDVLPVLEEHIALTKARQRTGTLRVSTRTDTVESEQAIDLSQVEVEVFRLPVNRQIDTVPDIVTTDDLTIIPVVEERVVLTRALFLREEVHVRKITRHETARVPVTTKIQTAHIERLGADDQSNGSAPEPLKETKMAYEDNGPMTGSVRTVSALFDTRGDAQNAVDRLLAAGLTSGQVRMLEGSADEGAMREDRARGFWESLGDLFFPDSDRYTYTEGLSRGGYLVTVTNVAHAHYDTVLDILDDEGTVNLDEREESWRSEGWTDYDSSSYASMPSARGMRDTGQDRHDEGRMVTDGDSIPVVEERLDVGKRDASHGRVRVRAYTVEEPVTRSVNLHEEHVELERRPVDRAAGPGDVFDDRSIEAEEYSEEAVVSKEARVVEEIGLRRVSDEREETVSDTVRHTEIEVEDDRTMADRDRARDRVNRDRR